VYCIKLQIRTLLRPQTLQDLDT